MADHRPVSTALVSIAAAGVVGGVVGGLLVWLVVGGDRVEAPRAKAEAPRSSAATAAAAGGAGPGAIASRLELLEAQVAGVQSKQRARAALAAYNAGAGRGDDDDAAGAEEWAAPVIDQEDPTFEQAVRGVLDRVDEEREARRALRGQDRARAVTDLLAGELQLTDAQRPEVERILTQQHTKFSELRHPPEDAGVQRPVTRRQWRERMNEIRTETERQLGAVLSEGQMQRFQAISEEEGIGPGWGRGRGDRPARGAAAPQPQ